MVFQHLSSVFGWKYTEWGADYVDSDSAGVNHAFNADGEHKPAMSMIVVYAHHLEKTKLNVIKNGGKTVKDIFTFPDGRRFHFLESSGNLLAVCVCGLINNSYSSLKQ